VYTVWRRDRDGREPVVMAPGLRRVGVRGEHLCFFFWRAPMCGNVYVVTCMC
jgi:hypothetical protein